MVLVTGDRLDGGFDAQWSAAVKALAKRPAPTASRQGGLWRFEGDDYTAAAVLLTDALTNLDLDGAPVVVPLSRTTALAVGDKDLSALTAAAEAQAEQRAGRDFFPGAIRRGPEGWVDVELTPQLTAFARSYDYDSQQTALRLAFERSDAGDAAPFVASLKVAQSPSGRVLTIGVLTETVPTLLPECDAVLLNNFGAVGAVPVGFVPLRRLVDVLGLRQTADWPVRYDAPRFPTKAELARLKPEPKPE